jgi:Flp pilus assembly protein CpaB
MNRRRTFLIIFIVLILILGIGVVALLVLGGGLGGGAEETPVVPVVDDKGTLVVPTPEIVTKNVVVALQTIPRGMRIPLDAVDIRAWPQEDLPEDPIYDLEEVIGMVARTEIPARLPISASKVKAVFQGDGSELSLAVPKGKVLIAVPITAMSAAGNALLPGDRVDVLVSLSFIEVDEESQIRLPLTWSGGEDCLAGCQPQGEPLPRLVTQYTVQNALVLGVGLWEEQDVEPTPVPSPGPTDEAPVIVPEEEAQAPAPASLAVALTDIKLISLAVNPQDALVLKWLRESNASIDMVMRSAIDEDLYNPESVTLQYMLDRFSISVPPKLPHSPENEFEYSLIDTALQYQTPAQ